MFQLILVVLAIALTAALLMVTVKYLPWWNRAATHIEEATRTSLVRLEQAYDVAARAGNGVAPALTADPDGGFAEHFRPILKLLPAAPSGSSWTYGQYTGTSPEYANMHFFCLSNPQADEALWRGVNRARSSFSADQAFIKADTGCGALSSDSLPTSFPAPMALTFYVTYVPGITK